MKSEIKKNTWSRFCRKFSACNQYRSATVEVRNPGEAEGTTYQQAPLMGLGIVKKGRLIDGIELYLGDYDPDSISQPVVSVNRPVKVVVEKDKQGMDRGITVEGEDGTIVSISLSGEKNPDLQRVLVEKVAYLLGERRGFTPGAELDDWCEAERIIQEAETACLG